MINFVYISPVLLPILKGGSVSLLLSKLIINNPYQWRIRGRPLGPNGTQFFLFRTWFCWKAPRRTSAPQREILDPPLLIGINKTMLKQNHDKPECQRLDEIELVKAPGPLKVLNSEKFDLLETWINTQNYCVELNEMKCIMGTSWRQSFIDTIKLLKCAPVTRRFWWRHKFL